MVPLQVACGGRPGSVQSAQECLRLRQQSEVEEAVRVLMCTQEGQVAKKNVARLQIACGDPSSSDRNLKKFVNDLRLQSRQ